MGRHGHLHDAVADYKPSERRLIKRCQVAATRFFRRRPQLRRPCQENRRPAVREAGHHLQGAASIAEPGATVARPAKVQKMDFEGELAVVIGDYARDVIATGTPAGDGAFRKPPQYLQPGDRIRIEVSRVGILDTLIG